MQRACRLFHRIKKRSLHVGDIVLAIGNPYNLGQSISLGIVSALGRNVVSESGWRQNFIQTDASINRGNSGGALINARGKLVGISVLTMGRTNYEVAEGIGFAIPVEIANNVLRKIIQDGRVIRSYFGVQTEILFNNGKGMREDGVIVTNIMKGSPADKGGIQIGDTIVQVGNTKIESPSQIIQLVNNLKPDTEVEVIVERSGRKVALNITIEEYLVN